MTCRRVYPRGERPGAIDTKLINKAMLSANLGNPPTYRGRLGKTGQLAPPTGGRGSAARS